MDHFTYAEIREDFLCDVVLARIVFMIDLLGIILKNEQNIKLIYRVNGFLV